MLLGHNDQYTADKIMRVTIAFNRFASGLTERMPRWELFYGLNQHGFHEKLKLNIVLTCPWSCRVRFGYAHVVNNKYDEWKMYAIGGSANPTILSEGNFYVAPNDPNAKQVKIQ